MVGVPGKYRGCETCRSRRVKCGNERPICKRCADSNRDCTYERETVFIVASIEDGGRCSSHPPRKTAKKKTASKSKSRSPAEEKLALIAEEPFTSAWNDLVSVSNFGKRYTLQIAALHTRLHSVVRSPGDSDSDDGRNKTAPLSFTPYDIPDVQPSPSDDDFQIKSRCMVHLPSLDRTKKEDSPPRPQIDGVFLFLYEQNNSTSSGTIPPWRDLNAVRQQGPESFRSFPKHHYFVRVFRPNAIGVALLNHKQSFLSEPPWVTAPFEIHPKSTFDHLLDIIVLVPAILQRADRIIPQEQTLVRRLMAQDLLDNCIRLESQFDSWLVTMTTAASQCPTPTDVFWIEITDNQMIPFADTFAFRDGLTALSMIYYWASQLLFCPTVERLYWTFFQPVVDGPFPQAVPILPPTLEDINMIRYGRKAARELASNVCRSLDFALARMVQPDLLVVPLWVVWQFYLNVGLDTGTGTQGEDELFGDGRLELMWCEAFRGKLTAKGRGMQEVVEGRGWREVGVF
ncbi:hypothetical protein QBC34DRAFT_3554 [Podospora aff. communis PSN243]|uniref:Zn(2)-C6 fungal-type domain-containing protein n=1 Tax=Podospora aff. communis PSN243 TaxID=3040156 RepID=A0AAV9H5B2_9PEZI|nr:hypothetical protein QBC34DRAFT_3554 [Podospora aff. communis PSN243]